MMTYQEAQTMVKELDEASLRHMAMACMARLRELRVTQGHAPYACNRAQRAIDDAWVSEDGR